MKRINSFLFTKKNSRKNIKDSINAVLRGQWRKPWKFKSLLALFALFARIQEGRSKNYGKHIIILQMKYQKH